MKKQTAKITALFAAVMMFAAAGCSNGNTANTTTSAAPAPETTTTEDTEAPVTEEQPASESEKVVDAESGEIIEEEEVEEDEIEGDTPYTSTVKIAALKGPTAMGLTKLMNDCEESGVSRYEFEIYAAPDEITPMLIQGTADIACVPANLASVLYNKTEGEIDVLAINTLGVIYIVENGTENINSIADLKGKTIYASGQGSTPEFALNYLLEANGIKDDVNIEWKTEHAECVTAILEEEGGIAMLPQPFVTTAMVKNEGIRTALSLTDEWEKLDNGSSMLTGVVVARKDFIEAEPDEVKAFMDGYKISVDYVNSDIDGAAALVGKYDIVPEAIAKKALPACNITFISGEEMKQKLSGYLQVLYDSEPKSVGGKLPGDDFYYIG